MAMSQQLLRLQNLSKYYTTGNSVVVGLNEISVSFNRGEFVVITGESGSGKSTLAHVLGGILPYESGEMLFLGHPTSHFDSSDYANYRRDYISFISQNYGILPACTVFENVVSALRLTGVKKRTAQKETRRILEEVELWKLRNRRAAKLSSGQKQRLSIARALAKPAPILLADEPTGNLDEENSLKIMELLAHAAKDRLVILITHEFSEAEAYATRHITIQNGRIAVDAALRPAPEAEEYQPMMHKKRQHLSPYIARLQLRGRPVWAWLVLLFFTLTAFCVFAFLGTFIIATDDTPTRLYDNSAFRNGADTRIVAVRTDAAPMTQEDYENILSVQYVESLEPYGYVADVNYAYQKGIDYRVENTAQDEGSWDDPNMVLTSAVYMAEDAGYLQTIPQLSGEKTFLTAGTLPENHRQVVLAGTADQIGTTFPVYLQDMKHWNRSAMLSFEVEVVGVTDYGTGLYFHEDIGRVFTHAAAYDYENYIYLPAEDLMGELVRTSEYVYGRHESGYQPYIYAVRGEYTLDEVLEYEPDAVLRLSFIEDPAAVTSQGSVPIEATHNSLLNSYCEVSPEVFEAVTWKQAPDQVSITISDYAYTDRVLEALKTSGYIAISPFREGSTKVDPVLDAERKQTLAICAAALLAVVLLQITVLRAMFSTQTESYQILSHIGLSCGSARRSILWQVLLFTMLGQSFGFGLLMLCNRLGIAQIVYVLRYLPPVYMAVLSAVHWAAALLAAAWILRAITKQVFPLAGKTDDLPMTNEEAVV